nr:proto-oncogene Mas-like [Pogona vitticeps]
MIILAIPICILGLFANAMVFYFLCSKIKKTKFTVYFMNMIFADIIVLLYQYTYFMLFLKPTEVTASVSNFLELTYMLAYNSGLYVLTALCAERCVLVFFPIWYRSHRPKHFSFLVCALSWIFSALVSIMEYFTCYPRFYAYLDEDSYGCYFQTIFQIIIFLIFVPIMAISTLAIFIRMKQKVRQGPPAPIDVTITAVVIFFLIFDSSVRVYNFLEYWYDALGVPLFTISVLFDAIARGIDPFLFFFVGYCSERECDPLEVFVERSLQDERNRVEGT